jgi:hypothetical protein
MVKSRLLYQLSYLSIRSVAVWASGERFLYTRFPRPQVVSWIV